MNEHRRLVLEPNTPMAEFSSRAARKLLLLAPLVWGACHGGHQDGNLAPVVVSLPAMAPRCDEAQRQRARIRLLLAEGRLDRAVRVIELSNALCPSTAPATWKLLLETLVELGRVDDAEALIATIRDSPGAPGEAKEAAQQLSLLAQRERGRPLDPQGLFSQGVAEKFLGHTAAARRLFDRALVDLERAAENETGEPNIRITVDVATGIRNPIHAWAWSPTSAMLAVAHGRTISILSTSVRAERFRLSGDSEPIKMLSFSPDGLTLLSASKANKVRLWSVKTGRELRSFDRKGGLLLNAAWQPKSGRGIALAQQDRIELVDPTTGSVNASLPCQCGNLSTLAFSTNGEMLLATFSWGGVAAWEVASRTQLPLLREPQGTYEGTWTHDGKLVALIDDQSRVKVWDPYSGRILWTRRESAPLTGYGLAFSSDDATLAIAGVAYSTATGTNPRPLGLSHVYSFAPDGSLIWGTRPNGPWFNENVEHVLLDTTTLAVRTTYRVPTTPARALTWSQNGAVLAMGLGDGTVRAWDVNTGQSKLVSPNGFAAVASAPEARQFSVTADGQTIATCCRPPDKEPDWNAPATDVCIWDTEKGISSRIHRPEVTALALSPDGSLIAVSTADQITYLYDARSHTVIRSLAHPCGDKVSGKACPMQSMAFTQDGKALAMGLTGLLILWDVETGAHHETGGIDVPFCFGSSSRYLASTNYAHPIFDLSGKAPQRLAIGPTGSAVAISPTDKLLAVGGQDAEVHLMDAHTEKDVRVLREHDGAILGLAFNPGGQRLASSSEDSTINVWSTESGRIEATIRVVTATDAWCAQAKGYIESHGEAARDLVVCRAGPLTLPYEACAERFEVPGLLGRILRGEQLEVSP